MIQGREDLARKLEALEGVADQHMERLVRNQVVYVQAEAKSSIQSDSGQLKGSIHAMVDREGGMIVGTVYTNESYAAYVEMGTGPKGEANHSGISPAVNPAYTQSPWWIHESQIDKGLAERYHWFYIETDDGRFYRCTGQPAQPYMYPALKNNEDKVARNMENALKRELRKVCR